MFRRTKSCSTTCAELVLAALLASSPALAQDPTATALFKAGKDLAGQGNYKEACPKFEASFKHEALLGTLMNLADCHEKVGAIARAWSEWGAALEMARKASDAPRADLSKRRQDALEPRVPKMKVTVTGSAAGLAVWRDDRALDSLEYDVDLPVELGKHVVTVRRGDAVLETEERIAEESAHLVVSFDLAKIAAAHPAPVSAPAKPEPGPIATKAPRPWQYTVGPIAIAAGGTAVVAGFVFELAALGMKNNADCAKESGLPSLCTQAGLDKIATARGLATTGVITMVVGSVIAIGGGLLIVFSPKQTTNVGVVPLPGGAAATWGMRF